MTGSAKSRTTSPRSLGKTLRSALRETGGLSLRDTGGTIKARETRESPHQLRSFMRSCSGNPFVDSPRLCEHPCEVARASPKYAWGAKPPLLERPVNKRNYVTPAFWVKSVERGDMSATTTYLDYPLTTGFTKFWQAECDKEMLAQIPAQARKGSASVGSRSRSPKSTSSRHASPRPGLPKGRMSLARMTAYASSSTPSFLPLSSTTVKGFH
mmetsp:Transcript_78197/g.205216  ORF Transcript_78197/g.205216 Transcript_78197/m.205216 type:complete len:212 (-) Transcript_78197:114-749(-)